MGGARFAVRDSLDAVPATALDTHAVNGKTLHHRALADSEPRARCSSACGARASARRSTSSRPRSACTRTRSGPPAPCSRRRSSSVVRIGARWSSGPAATPVRRRAGGGRRGARAASRPRSPRRSSRYPTASRSRPRPAGAGAPCSSSGSSRAALPTRSICVERVASAPAQARVRARAGAVRCRHAPAARSASSPSATHVSCAASTRASSTVRSRSSARRCSSPSSSRGRRPSCVARLAPRTRTLERLSPRPPCDAARLRQLFRLADHHHRAGSVPDDRVRDAAEEQGRDRP